MKKFFFILAVSAIIILGLIAMVGTQRDVVTESKKVSVITTLFPLYDFAKNIGGDKADVSLLLPPGVEPHGFEPTPSDIEKINNADVFIYTGKFMEPWAEDILGGISNKKTIVIDSSTGVVLTPPDFHDADEPNASVDPHIWLDFGNDKIIIKNISTALMNADSKNANYYNNNARKFANDIATLDNKFRRALSKCKMSEIIYGGHYAFGYLAKRYGLKYTAAQGISPDSEPTAKDLAELINQIENSHIKYVFYEELSSPKIAETIANETNAKLLMLNAVHNITKNDMQNGVSFIQLMENNLTNLVTGLECSK